MTLRFQEARREGAENVRFALTRRSGLLCKGRAQGTHDSDNLTIPEGDESLSVPVGSPLSLTVWHWRELTTPMTGTIPN